MDNTPAAGAAWSPDGPADFDDGREQVKATDPLCAPHLATGSSVKAVTTVQGTAMCEAHAREWFGGVSTRG